jgi:hypothetical protein
MAEYQSLSGASINLYKINSWGKRKSKSISKHRLIWIKQNGPIEKGLIIHHKDFNKNNNEIDNLECLTPKEHRQKHLIKH